MALIQTLILSANHSDRIYTQPRRQPSIFNKIPSRLGEKCFYVLYLPMIPFTGCVIIRKEIFVFRWEIGFDVDSNSSALPCMDKLKEELSCAICLEICFEPSTTPCGHSFCRKCLKSAADKCGKKCPKCRQLISNGRSCTVSTVLWNTIQLLFPQEIEARKVAASAINNRQAVQNPIPETTFYTSTRNRSLQAYPSSRGMNSRRSEAATTTQDEEDAALARRLQREIDRENNNHRTTRNQTSTLSSIVRAMSRRGVSNQDEDAAFALRLQRNEFMQAFRSSSQEPSSSSSTWQLEQ